MGTGVCPLGGRGTDVEEEAPEEPERSGGRGEEGPPEGSRCLLLLPEPLHPARLPPTLLPYSLAPPARCLWRLPRGRTPGAHPQQPRLPVSPLIT